MSHFLYFLIALVLGIDAERQFIGLVRNMELSIDAAAIAERKKEVDALLVGGSFKENNFRWHFLRLIKNDLQIMTSKMKSKSIVAENLAAFVSGNDFSSKNPIGSETIEKLSKLHGEIIDVFGKCSYFDHLITCKMLGYKMISFPKRDFSLEINEAISRFSSRWGETPMLNQLYILKCRNLINTKNYRDAFSAAKAVKNMRFKICDDELDVMHISSFSYEIQSLCGLGDYSGVIALFKKIPVSLLECSDRKYLAMISCIYSASSASYFEIGNVELSCVYQEFALAKMYEWALDRNDPDVLEQAIRLQLLLVKKGDQQALRAIEERYNLKPIRK